MTRRIDDGNVPVLLLEGEPDGTCEMCGKVEELRPYGPKGERVCFDCAMKDRAAAERQFAKRLMGVEPPSRAARESGVLGPSQGDTK